MDYGGGSRPVEASPLCVPLILGGPQHLEKLEVAIPLQKAFVDGPRDVQPHHTTPEGGHLNIDGFYVHRPSTRFVFSCIWIELLKRHSRVFYLDY
ncbi:hypothetical protein TNCV_2471061 [Trichonephila clavipes]|nr:hypothetical protein TNCV_2471061 [Trichonephila clavipes]